MIKAIFWDFDGVIAESVNVKTEAFYNLYLPYGIEIAEKVRRHHLDNGGMSRFEKFRYYQTRLLGEPEPVDEKAIKKLAAHFSELVLEGVINAPFVPDVEKVLREKSGKMDFYVISGAPTEEMRLIVENAVSRPVSRVYSALRKANRTGARHCCRTRLPARRNPIHRRCEERLQRGSGEQTDLPPAPP